MGLYDLMHGESEEYFSAGFTGDAATGDLTVEGQTYPGAPALPIGARASNATATVARVGRSQVLVGIGAFQAPRS